ncbi:cell division protein FtsN [Sphingobium jiangsuense]|uniref:Cell division protein FtsN n=2 Tax=Sphingobium jiangsuense TaxID=870476 RepID=A0A7W6FNR7_9SPHN|nr:SPOR domain-containing protein [Sphingobium jiangsuense]MBB3925361.1 cell division protein FtsN [Sphingobium jiangsuense]
MTHHFPKSDFRRPALASALSPFLVLAALVAGASCAFADVKAGVDAWGQGDYAKAIQEWTPLAQAGDADAQFNLGQAYKLGRGVPASLDTALDYYRKAALQGHARAEDNYGLLLFQKNRRVEAMPYIQRSAERGEARAQYIYGVALFNGDLTAKDWPRAYAMMTRAAKADLPQATASLAQMNQYIPEEQRLKGLALAEEMDKQEQAAKFAALGAPLSAAPAAPLREPPRPLKQTALPPAETGTAVPAPTPAPSPPPVKAAPAKIAEAKPAPAKPASAPVAAQPKAAEAPKAPAKATPKPAAPVAAPKGKWRIQLGAFSAKARAESQWKLLTGKVGGLSAHSHYVEQSGAVSRLQAGPFATQEEAARLCAKVKAAGSDCLVKTM